ncbi:hypothetical protein Goarm_013228 [Gossypium armourianum]|uniref:Uncharacterized protein n=2 Tax=Gossypium TaxID=3633 RepID=A0A7J9J2H0_9ROSI|nr:hypothetical protein [Gossypium armourianum]
MHAKNRIPSSGHSTPSPPASPLRSPRYRHGRKSGRFSPFQPGRTIAHRLAWLLLSVLLRRQGIFLFAPLIYISGMLLYMGTVSFDVVPVIKHRPAPGSVYRSPQLYEKLKIDMNADNSSADAAGKLMILGAEDCQFGSYVTDILNVTHLEFYVPFLVFCKFEICNAVAVAGYLNATLLIPNFHFHSIWRDPRFVIFYFQLLCS